MWTNIISSFFLIHLPIAFSCVFTHAQNVIDWDGKYILQLDDFQGGATQIGDVNIYSLHTATGMNFAFHMSNAEFMFTKNFNSKVSCSFARNASSLIAPDSNYAINLLAFARFEFDLAELYARKFRQKLQEAKGTFSNANFFEPVYQTLQIEYNERHARAGKATDIGQESSILQEYHEQIIAEINDLSAYCKTCKPPRKSKTKSR
ncbi:MAG: hypothetical protein IPL46_24245 [Saprospiraceae bacterium]|nr:hypothetical protein [Saprospiraceae bacterium]